MDVSECVMPRWLLLTPALVLLGCASQQHRPSDAPVGKWEFATPESVVLEERPIPEPSSADEYSADLSPRDLPAALRFLEAVVELERIRRAHPERYEATYNEAILIHEYGILVESKHAERVLVAASRLYRQFIASAESDPDARYEVRRAKERLQGIESLYFCDFKTPSEERRRMQQEAAEREAREEMEWNLEVEKRNRQREEEAQREAEKPSPP